MIDHTGIHVSDLARSTDFYRQALAPLGYELRCAFPGAAGFGEANGKDPGGDFWLSSDTPYTPRSHIAFHAASQEQVCAFYQAALQAGGSDNGAPGLRPHYHAAYFAAFIHDPDGYNIEAVFHGQ